MINRLTSERTRPIEAALLGALLVTLGIVTYPIVAALELAQGAGSGGFVVGYAYLTLGFTTIGSCVLFCGATRALTKGSSGEKSNDARSTSSIVAEVFVKRRYSRLLVASALGYGVFYAFASGIIVFQPALSFSAVYHVGVPSLAIATCCGTIGETPEAVVYVTQHLGLLLVPLNLLLLFSISWLVGLNASLASFALRFRTRNVGLNWFGGIGAFMGLFTACPTCAGLAIITILGGTGTLSAALFLGRLQTLFLALSIPILVVTPIISVRSLHSLERRACARRYS